jgi:hypothetical protein
MSNSAQLDQIPFRWDEFQWCGDLNIPLMGQPTNPGVELFVNTKDEEQIPPCEDQVTAWRRFVERDAHIYSAILGAGFSFYTRMRPTQTMTADSRAFSPESPRRSAPKLPS